MDLSLQSIKTNNWSANNFRKTCHLNVHLALGPAIQSAETGQVIPFLTITWMFIRMSTIKLNMCR